MKRALSTLFAATLTGLMVPPAAGQGAERRLDTTIRKALADRGDIVTPADHRAIRAKCGLAADIKETGNVSFSDGGLHCPDGRVVRDAETREMADRIAARAKAHVAAVMKNPAVTAAIEAVGDEASLSALRRIRSDRR